MKRFTFKGVLENFRTSLNQQNKNVNEIEESLRKENFDFAYTIRHGFPHGATSLAYDPVQNLLAIGTDSGFIRIFGKPGIDIGVKHVSEAGVQQILFIINEGLLISACADDTLHLWNIKPKQPTMVHSLKFQRERITYSHLPFQSKWLYVGTERGNIHVVNVDSFKLSGYVINWNKTIALISKAHPGPIVHISDNPVDSNKLLIGFESGSIVLWDLKNKAVDSRFSHNVNLCSVSWHYEGKSFISSHSDGSLITWVVKQGQASKPSSIIFPHARSSRPSDRSEHCSSIDKVEWKTTKTGENLIIFSGGLCYMDKEGSAVPTMTVMQGKSTTVLEMENPIVDFLAISRSPYPSEPCEPSVLTVLYCSDLVLVDLTTQGFPCFENPFALDVHESPVTVVKYFADCPGEIIPLLYSVGMRQKKTGYSEKNWPLTGGEGGKFSSSYPEIILTGHADGTVKFWDASAMNLQILYRLKSSKLFERQPSISKKRASPSRSDTDTGPDNNYPSRSQTPAEGQDDSEDVYKKNMAVAEITFDPGSRYLAVVGGGDVPDYTVLYSFDRSENRIPQIPYLYVQVEDDREDLDGSSIPAPLPTNEPTPIPPPRHKEAKHTSTLRPYDLIHGNPNVPVSISSCLKKGALKQLPGFQVELVIFLSSPLPSSITETAGQSTSAQADGEEELLAGYRVKILAVKIQPLYGLIAIGTTSGLCIIDFVNKSILINLSTPDFYGSNDPFSRSSKQPNKRPPSTDPDAEKVKSPSLELVPAPSLTGNTTTAGPKSGSFKLARDRSASAKDRTHNKSTVSSGQKRRATLNQVLGHIGLDYFSSSPKTDDRPLKLNHDILRETKVEEHEGEMYCYDAGLSCQGNYLKALRSLTPKIQVIETEYCGRSEFESNSGGDQEEDDSTLISDPISNMPTGLTPFRDNPAEGIDLTGGSGTKLADKYKSAKLVESGKLLQPTKQQVPSKTVNVINDDFDQPLTNSRAMEYNVNVGKSTNIVREPVFVGSLNQGPNTITINNLQSPPGPESLAMGSPTSSGLGFPLEGVVDLAFYHQALGPSMASKGGNQTSISTNLSAPSTSNTSGSANQERCINEICGPLPPLWLWMGTSYGSTLVLSFTAFTSSSVPFNSKNNAAPVGAQQPVIVSPTGLIIRLKGSMLNISYFTNPIVNQTNMSSPSQPCAPTSATSKKAAFSNTLGDVAIPGPTSSVTIIPGSACVGSSEQEAQIPSGSGTMDGGKNLGHQASVISSTVGNREFAILISECQACAVAMPSMSVTYKVKTATEGRKIMTARVCKFYNQHCLTCYSSNGHIVVYSVPSFRLLFDIFLVSPSDLRFNTEDHEEITDIRRVISFSSHGNGLYLCSPSEIQKFTYSAELCKHLSDMTSRLFRLRETPEPPKPSFFTNLFNNKSLTFDREELFGEASGKYSRAQATHIPGPSSLALQDTAQNANALAAGPVQKARLALNERGEKLGDLDERMAQMAMHAEGYSKNAHDIMLKYKEKKWYQF